MTYITFSEDILALAKNAKESKTVVDVYNACKKYFDSNSIPRSYVLEHTYFSDDGLYHANELTNIIATITDFVELVTRVPYKEFHIIFEFKYTIVIHSVNDISYKLLQSDTLYIDKDVDMIYIYSILSNIEHKDNWEKYTETLSQLTNSHKGGYDSSNQESITLSYKNVGSETLWPRLASLNVVWTNTRRMSCITDNKTQTLQMLKHMFRNIIFKDFDYKVPVDYREVKTTVYAEVKDRKIPILDIFNNAEFELIPYCEKQCNGQNIKLAHRLTQLRFLYIEKTVSRLKTILGYKDDVNPINKDINVMLSNVQDSNAEPPQFYGQYYPKHIAIKEQYLDSKFGSYTPYGWYKHHGSYRELVSKKTNDV